MNPEIQKIKQRFGIIGNAPGLNRAIDIATQVAATDLSVLITGESGTGKEIFPQIIHQLSHRKHNSYIAINCGAIPEGTIDSELFGHEKGAFTGAHEHRKGYFEVADGGTIFLDEVGELPLATQVRLLRVLETGEFIKVGTSKVIKTNVRVIAATNVNMAQAIKEGKFREDLYYRLNTVPVNIPPLRNRNDDIYLLFRKFAQDFSEKYRMPPVKLDESAQQLIKQYRWPGNIRQLKNITEQISIIEQQRVLSDEKLRLYLPQDATRSLPALYNDSGVDEKTFASEREILYKILFDMKNDMNELKKVVNELRNNPETAKSYASSSINISDHKNYFPVENDYDYDDFQGRNSAAKEENHQNIDQNNIEDTQEIVEESLSLSDKEVELIKKALEKHNGKRKMAAEDLGISERTLYRKIKEYDIQG